MKIEIDLDDVFRDEEGEPGESIQESVRRQIIDRLSGDMRKRLFARLDEELSTIMREQISVVMAEKMPDLIDDIMNGHVRLLGDHERAIEQFESNLYDEDLPW